MKKETLKALHEKSGENYKRSLDYWVDKIWASKTPPVQSDRVIGWTGEELNGKPVVAGFKDVNHAVGERKDRTAKGGTNMKSAYAAGKYARLTDEDGLTNFPYWQYVHGYYGKPNEPRDEHVKWDGMILPANHPWFDTHFPPNGWNCNCGVEQISAKEAKVTERPSGKNDVPPEWATNVGINDAAGAQSLMRHIERISSKGGEYKIIAQKAFEHLKENSAKIYGKTLDVWVDEVFDGNYTKQKKERTVAITDEGIITADKESVNHAIRTKKPTQQRLSREQAKELPAFIADAESVYEDKKNGGLLYFKKLNDEKEVKISVKNNKFITAVKQNNKESQGNIEYKRGLKR